MTLQKTSNPPDLRRLVADADRARDEKQWGAAADLYGRYLRLRPRDGGIWVQYGHCLKESGNLSAADAAYYEALRKRPWETDTYLQIGHLRRLQQRPGAALFWYQLASGLAARHGDARREAETLEAQGIMPAPERLPVPWVRVLIAILRRVRRPPQPPQRTNLEAVHVRTSTEADLNPFETAWRQYLPSFMEAASNMAALGHEYARLRRDLDRRLSEQDTAFKSEIAALREQIETMCGASRTGSAVPQPFLGQGARILAVDRVEAAKQKGVARLHIGAARTPMPDTINIGTRASSGVDIVGADAVLPFEKGTVDAIVVTDMLQRFAEDDLEHRLLPYWLSLLKPGGEFVAIVPDSIAMIAAAADGTISFADFRSMLLERDCRHGASHANLFSYDSLLDLLQRTGFRDIDIPARARPSGSSLEFEIRARAPGMDHG